ncbi:hypothetical protein [Dehalococcoides sp.]|jgi:hypothetical protein|uniref:hypothetical protein n=1 Tax=Dehalococcoides sp. TaxID=1966486 RepID=UPI003567EF24
MSVVSGKLGGVFTSALLIENCEAAWDELVDGDVTASADSTDVKVGAYSAKFACAAGLGAGDIIAANDIASKDLSAYKKIYAWVKSSVALDAGDVQLLLDDTAQCASVLKSLNLPALSANTWTRVLLDLGDASSLTAVISVGLKQVVDKGAFNLWIDDIEALKAIAGIKSWQLDYTVDILDSTSFIDAGARTFSPGSTQWGGSFEGYKYGAPLGIGSEVILALAESATTGQAWIGNAYISGAHVTSSLDALVTYSYDFQGTGSVEVASL